MKKTLKFILGSLMFIPLTVKADMSAPEFSYKVRVSNTEGAQSYDIKYDSNDNRVAVKGTRKADFDTVLRVIDEINISKDKYVYACDDNSGCDYFAYKDIELIKKINLDDYKNKYNLERVVIREGAYLYNGPSYTFGKVDDEYMLPVGAKFSTYYYNELFAYVEYKGHKGWVLIYEYEDDMNPYGDYGYVGHELSEPDKFNYYTVNDAKLYKDITDENSTDVILPKNTKITPIVAYNPQAHSTYYQIEYKGEKYWYKDGALKYKDSGTAYAFTDLKIYTNVDDLYDMDYSSSNYTGKTIPQFTKFKYEYVLDTEYGEYTAYEVNYNGTRGWVIDDSDKGTIIEDSFDSSTYKLLSDLTIYKNPNGNEKGITIKKGSIIKTVSHIADFDHSRPIYTDWTYIKVEDVEGWAKSKDMFYELYKEGSDEDNDRYRIHNEREQSNPTPDKKPSVDDEEEETNNIMLYCIISGVVLVLSAVLTIIFINKKKKNKNDENKDNKKENKKDKKKNKKNNENELEPTTLNEAKEENKDESVQE